MIGSAVTDANDVCAADCGSPSTSHVSAPGSVSSQPASE